MVALTWARREPRRPGAAVPAPPSGDDTLEGLVALVAGGDEPAFAELYRRVAPAVFGLVTRVVRDPAQSEEVTQEVFVELWRTASRFDPTRATARSWILTCAHRRAVDRVRSAERAARRDDLAGRRDQGRPYDEVVEQVEAGLEREHVRRSLHALTDLQREAVVLAYWGGYTHREIAELLGVPSGTVKTRLRDGLLRLRDQLGVVAWALLVVAVLLGALNLGSAGRAGGPERPADLVAAVLAAPDARRVAALPGGAGQAAVVVSPRRGQAVFEASGLAPAPAGRTYQLWVVGRSGPRPAGLVEAGGGRVTRLLDGPVTGTEQVAMTVERRGGAARPTSEPVVVVDLRA